MDINRAIEIIANNKLYFSSSEDFMVSADIAIKAMEKEKVVEPKSGDKMCFLYCSICNKQVGVKIGNCPNSVCVNRYCHNCGQKLR